jgi:hypothetical protein
VRYPGKRRNKARIRGPGAWQLGVIRDFIQQFLPEIGEAIKRMDYQMQKITQAFISHIRAKITKMLSKI